MPQVYVAGPVVRQNLAWDVPEWIQGVYNTIDSHTRQYNQQVVLPFVDAGLDVRSPKDFFHEVRKRIASSRAVIAVYEPGDVSCAIEATIASASGKKVLIVAKDIQEVPRLLEGLPNTELIAADSFSERVTSVLRPSTSERAGRQGAEPTSKKASRGENLS